VVLVVNKESSELEAITSRMSNEGMSLVDGIGENDRTTTEARGQVVAGCPA